MKTGANRKVIMKKTFFKIVLFAVGALAFLPSGNFYAQTTPKPSVKRNSPFSPNPKKKVETAKTNPEEIKSATTENPVKIENAKLTINNNNGALQAENNQTSQPEKQSAQFESRSVAKKTLD